MTGTSLRGLKFARLCRIRAGLPLSDPTAGPARHSGSSLSQVLGNRQSDHQTDEGPTLRSPRAGFGVAPGVSWFLPLGAVTKVGVERQAAVEHRKRSSVSFQATGAIIRGN